MESVDIICSEFLYKGKKPLKTPEAEPLHVQLLQANQPSYGVNLSMGDTLRNFFHTSATRSQPGQTKLLGLSRQNSHTCQNSSNCTCNGAHHDLHSDRDFNEF